MRQKIEFEFLIQLRNSLSCLRISSSLIPPPNRQLLGYPKYPNNITIFGFHFLGVNQTTRFVHSVADSCKVSGFDEARDDQSAIDVHNILKNHRESSIEVIERVLNKCSIVLTDGLVLNVLDRNQSDWKPAYNLFQLLCKRGDNSSGSVIYNEILNILGKTRRFEEFTQVLDEMSMRKGLANEKTFGVLLNRYAAAHQIEEAIAVFERRREFELEDDLVAFQKLLMWLCRYKHVEIAESLFCSKRNELGSNIKTMNIILNGWCVLGNVHEAKRFWKDIIASECDPDSYTYGTFIHALTKKGKLGTATKLFRAMWKSGRNPDVTVCNNVIDALCFKKRIPEALEVFKEMSEKGCSPNVVTYNSLVKHLCKIRRMEVVYELLDEMEQKGGTCLPNDVTFSYLLKSSKRPEEVEAVLERMEKNECKMTSDLYNLIFKLYMDWGHEGLVREIWVDMEKNGLGPDQRTYTIMVHGLCEKGRIKDALSYYQEMVSKGLMPEPRTEIMVNEVNVKLETETEGNTTGLRNKGKSSTTKETREENERL